jgi:hypothetical protein
MVRDVGLKLAPLEQLQALNFRLSGLYTFLIFFFAHLTNPPAPQDAANHW